MARDLLKRNDLYRIPDLSRRDDPLGDLKRVAGRGNLAQEVRGHLQRHPVRHLLPGGRREAKEERERGAEANLQGLNRNLNR